MDLVRRTH